MQNRLIHLLSVSALLCTSLLPNLSHAQNWLGFDATSDYGAGFTPLGATTGDFNDDGITDFATANASSNNVSVLLGNGSGGNGDGTFAAPVNYSPVNVPYSVTTEDFNDDGISDLATANAATNNVSVLLGSGIGGIGDGTFATPINYPIGASPTNMTSGDFNSDGITDLATANYSFDEVSILLGNGSGGVGDGTLAAAVDYNAGGGPYSVTTGDFNGDDITDLATGNFDNNTVSILLGNGSIGIGDGTFATAVDFSVAGQPYSVATADFNGDGILDLVAANIDSDNVSVLLGNGSSGIGDGTFAAAVNYDAIEAPYSVKAADFNGDGITDLATANSDSDDVSVLLGNGSGGTGDGTFAAAVNYPVGDRPYTVMTGDFNSDGVMDLAATNANVHTVSVLLNLGYTDVTSPSSLATGPSGNLTQPSPTFDIAFTADDTHVGSSGVASVELFYQRGGGGYTSYGVYTTSPISFDTSTTGGDGNYDFYTVATDNASNTESTPAGADVSVTFNDNTGEGEWQMLDD